MNDIKAAFTGGIFSILGINILGLAEDIFTAFILGGVGAIGGWLVNRIIKYFEKRHGTKK